MRLPDQSSPSDGYRCYVLCKDDEEEKVHLGPTGFSDVEEGILVAEERFTASF